MCILDTHSKVTKHLSESETLFMQDGALGSHRSIETRVKVLTNDASTALYVKYACSSSSGLFCFLRLWLNCNIPAVYVQLIICRF
jgi:hypothetical protein